MDCTDTMASSHRFIHGQFLSKNSRNSLFTCSLISNFETRMENNATLAGNYNKRYSEVQHDCNRIFGEYQGLVMTGALVDTARLCCDWQFLGTLNFQYFSGYNGFKDKFYFEKCQGRDERCIDSSRIHLCHTFCKLNL